MSVLPITVLTGFLGSGKTTLLNHLLRQPSMAGALVIVNEFGEIGLDHELIEKSDEDTILLQSGCLCCTIRNDLVDTLNGISRRRAKGEIPAFDRVLVETTGLADPAPILQAVMTDADVAARYRLEGLVATVDAVAGEATLDRHLEAVKQAALADRLIVTKTDLASEADCAALESRLRALNPAAGLLQAQHGTVDPARLFDIGLYDPASKSVDVQRWLAAESYDHHAGHAHAPRDVNRHDAHIRALSIVLERPIPGEALDRWLQGLLRLKGPDLLRLKAIINVAELPGPLVLHAVQHVVHPPVVLPRWPSEDRRSRFVFITYDIEDETLRRSMAALAGDSAQAAE